MSQSENEASAEENGAKRWERHVLVMAFQPLDPTTPEASISPGLFSYVSQ